MSFIMTTFRCDTVVFLVMTICTLLQFSKGELETNPSASPSISSSISNYICNQQSQFQESGEIQTPSKTRPEDDDAKCGWYIWTKCDGAEGNSESCPSFVLQPCDQLEPEKTKKKGKGIATPQQQDQETRQFKHPCDNSTEKGLPDPQIVSSMTKYPSVVTIERGEGCQTKYCTGLILNENWIIVQQTGCFYLYQKDHSHFYTIVAGEGKMYFEEGTEQRRNVAEYIPHPGLKPEEFIHYTHNIGLVRVSTPFEFNENVQPIDLAEIEAIAPSIPSSTLTIVGWLKPQPMKEDDDELLSSLIESPLDFVPFDKCYDTEMERDNVTRDTDTLFCAGTCIIHGDEKNQPRRSILYAQKNSNSTPVPVGIGPGRHKYKPFYGVFVNLASYIPWIKETTEGQSQGQGQTTEIPESDSRIIRGDDAPPYKYKSMVNLESYWSYACTLHSCGGSILNEEWILTAAHCVDGVEIGNYRLVVGDYDISERDENEQILSVTKAIVHQDYDSKTFLNDIAVLKVSPPIQFNDKVQKVTLPEPSLEITGPLTAIGWGSTEIDYIQPHILQEIQLPFVPSKECQDFYANTTSHPGEGNICAGNETHVVCIGDSGGPIYQIGGSGEQVIVGLSSYAATRTCQNRNRTYHDTDPKRRFIDDIDGFDEIGLFEEPELPWRPAVFTKVAYYLEWIAKNIGTA